MLNARGTNAWTMLVLTMPEECGVLNLHHKMKMFVRWTWLLLPVTLDLPCGMDMILCSGNCGNS